jgi:hypothetical protein
MAEKPDPQGPLLGANEPERCDRALQVAVSVRWLISYYRPAEGRDELTGRDRVGGRKHGAPTVRP